MRKTFIVISILSALSPLANAKQLPEVEDEFLDFYGDEDFVSIATGTKTALHKAPAVATVITEQMISNMGARDIDDVLETVPGLHVNRSANGNEPIYTFRGVFSRFNPQVLMLVNGQPITNMFVGNRGQIWGGFPVKAISRIEVIRGPGSALYGADAFSGVINIITKSHKELTSNQASIGYGEDNTQSASLSYATQIQDVNASLIYEYYKTDGYDQIIEEDAQTLLDRLRGTEASLAPGLLRNGRKNHDLRVQLNYKDLVINGGLQKRIREPGVGITEALAPITTSSSEKINLDINYHTNLTSNAEINVTASHFRSSQEIDGDLILYPPGSDIGLGGPFPDGVIGNPEVFERHSRFQLQYDYSGFNEHSIKLGSGYTFSEIYKVQESKNFALGPNGQFLPPGSPVVDVSDTPFVFLPEGDRKNTYLFVQDVWQLANDWELTSGIRYDDYSDFGSTTNPRLALVWSTSHNLSTKFLFGKSFRAPSFANLFNINNPAALGNPNLAPEKMQTYEVSFDYHVTNLNLVASFFRYKWSDIITFVPDVGQTSSTAQNIGIHDGYGMELEALWQISDELSVRANYAHQDSEIRSTEQQVAYAPRHQLYAEVNYKIDEAINLNLNANHVADRKRDVLDPRSDIDDYTLVNVTLNWNTNFKGVSTRLSLRNLFDSDAREPTRNRGVNVNLPNDLPLTDRQFMWEVFYNFN